MAPTWPEVTPGEVDYSDPVAVTRGYIVTLGEWEAAVWAEYQRRIVADEPWSDLIASVGPEYDNLAEPFLTRRVRTYRPHSIGIPPHVDPNELLVDVDRSSPSKATVLTHDPGRASLRYERFYIVIRRHGEWRLDNLKARPLGTAERLRQRLL